jgi:hypothetical protein
MNLNKKMELLQASKLDKAFACTEMKYIESNQ